MSIADIYRAEGRLEAEKIAEEKAEQKYEKIAEEKAVKMVEEKVEKVREELALELHYNGVDISVILNVSKFTPEQWEEILRERELQ